MSLPKSAYGSILVTVIVLALALVAGNAVGGVQAAPAQAAPAQAAPAQAAPAQAAQPVAAPVRAAEAAPQTAAQGQDAIGEVTGTALAGDTVRVTQGETLIGETVAGADGTWRVPIPSTAAAATPYHVQIVPAAQRGAAPDPESPVSILVSVVVGSSKVQVRVQVISPNGQVDIEVLAPIAPCPCEAPAVEAQPAPQAAAEPTYHRVRSGETLSIIAARYGVTPQAVMLANRLRNPNLIFVGQRLLIPQRAK